MKFLRFGLGSLCMLAVVLGSASCRHYKMGSLAHPQLENIGIARVENATQEPRLAPYLQMKLPAQFMVDGSIKVKPEESAQTILHTRIVDSSVVGKGAALITEKNDPGAEDSEKIYRSIIYGISVQVVYWVSKPGRDDPVLAPQTVTGRATITEELDLTESRQRAFEVALADAANQIVKGVTEAW